MILSNFGQHKKAQKSTKNKKRGDLTLRSNPLYWTQFQSFRKSLLFSCLLFYFSVLTTKPNHDPLCILVSHQIFEGAAVERSGEANSTSNTEEEKRREIGRASWRERM